MHVLRLSSCHTCASPQANQILGLAPGEIFVQRNVGNQAMHTDLNLMSCLEYAVKSLKVGATSPRGGASPHTGCACADVGCSSC